MDVRNTFFFDHIPKTGGTSLQVFLTDAFGEDVTPIIKRMKLASAIALYQTKRIIIGHFGFVPGESLPQGYYWATVLRNPRERTISEYYFWVEDAYVAEFSVEGQRIKNMSLEEFLFDTEMAQCVYNYQAVHFASFFHPTPQHLSKNELLALAKRGLDQYHLVGTTERLGEFVECLKDIFDIPRELMLKRYNITSRKKPFSELPLDVQKRIDELTDVDMELWHYANHLFDTRTRHFSLPSFSAFSNGHSQVTSFPCASEGKIIEDGSLKLLGVQVISQMRPASDFISGELATLRISFCALNDIDDLTIGYSIHHDSGLHIFGVNTRCFNHQMSVRSGGDYYVNFVFPVQLNLGSYYVNIAAYSGLINSLHSNFTHIENCYLWREKVAAFNVVGFLDTPFEGIVRLMPYISFGALNEQGHIEAIDVLQGQRLIKRFGIVTPELSDTNGTIKVLSEIPPLRSDEQIAIPIEIVNETEHDWIGEGTKPVYIAYHWRRLNGDVVIFDGVRTPISGKIVPAKSAIRTSAMVEAPQEEGECILELSLVQETVCWFENRGFKTARVPVIITKGS